MRQSALAALLLALVLLLRPLSAGAAILERPTYVCVGTTATVTFGWRADADALEQWLDVSLVDNGFAAGTFVSVGPIVAGTTSYRWEGMRPNARHYFRLNSLTPAGWQSSATETFRAPCSIPEVNLGGPNAALGLTPGAYILDLDTGEVARLSDDRGEPAWALGGIETMSWSPTGEQIALQGFDRRVTIYNASSRTKQGELPFRAGNLRWLSGGDLTGTYERQDPFAYGQAVFDVASGDVKYFRELQYNSGSFSPDGRFLALPRPLYAFRQTPNEGGIAIIDTRTNQEWKIGTGEYHSLTWSPDGKKLLASRSWPEDQQALIVFDPLQRAELGRLPRASWLVWSPDSTLVAALTSRQDQPGQVTVFAIDGSLRTDLGPGLPAGWSPDGRMLAIIRDGQLWLADVPVGNITPLLRAQLPVISEAYWSPTANHIAFRAAGGSAIRVMDLDGSNERYVGQGSGLEWSPKGDRLAFGFRGGIYTMATNGTRIRRLVNVRYSDAIDPCRSGPNFQWSPDGSSVAFWREPERSPGLDSSAPTPDQDNVLVVRDEDGAKPRGVGKGYGPVWSPDGKRIAYVTAITDGTSTAGPPVCGARSVNVDDRSDIVLGRGVTNLGWSPDGSRVVGQSLSFLPPGLGSSPRIITMAADGSAAQRDLGVVGARPQWSPDGSLVGFSVAPGMSGNAILPPSAVYQLTVAKADGSAALVLADVRLGSWSWSPDGKLIAFTEYADFTVSGARSSIFLVPTDGSSPPRRLTEGSNPKWTPDGKQIALREVTDNLRRRAWRFRYHG